MLSKFYRPFRESNETTDYIHIQSGHPLSVTKQLPRSIEKRLSQLSPSKDIYFTKRHHIMSNVSPTVGVTKN